MSLLHFLFKPIQRTAMLGIPFDLAPGMVSRSRGHLEDISVSEADLRQAAKRLDSYHSNTVITPASNFPASASLFS